MFGIRKLKEQMSKLTHRVDLMEAELNRTSYRANQAELKCKILELEIKYPPKFKVGDTARGWMIVGVMSLAESQSSDRKYEVMSETTKVLRKEYESFLSK